MRRRQWSAPSPAVAVAAVNTTASARAAADLRDTAGAQEEVVKNITTGPTIKLADGTEQDHKIIDTKDQKELMNLADWILSQ